AAAVAGEGDQADERLGAALEPLAGEEVPVLAVGGRVGVDALAVAGELEPDAFLRAVGIRRHLHDALGGDGVHPLFLAAGELGHGLLAGLAEQERVLLAAVAEVLADRDAAHGAGDAVVVAGLDVGHAGDDLAV